MGEQAGDLGEAYDDVVTLGHLEYRQADVDRVRLTV